MNDSQSLYRWAMERQETLIEEARLRRLARQIRRGDLPASPVVSTPLLRVLAGVADGDSEPTQKSA
jgi:hypothetical protein